MERSLPMRGRKRPKSPHPAIIPESSRFGLVALAVTLLFLWAALTQQTILRLHHSTHTGLRSGGLEEQRVVAAGTQLGAVEFFIDDVVERDARVEPRPARSRADVERD